VSRPGVTIRFYDEWDGETREAWTDGHDLAIGIVGDDGEIEEEVSVCLPGKDWTPDELHGMLLEVIASLREERDLEAAFYCIFEDHHRNWTHYRGDLTDAKAMHGFLDDMADLIRRAKLAVDRRAEEAKDTAAWAKSKRVSLPQESGQ
jgi:hypothetical protein